MIQGTHDDLTSTLADEALDTVELVKEQLVITTGTVKSYLKTVNPEAKEVLDRYELPNYTIELRPIDKIKWHGKKGELDFDKGSTVECQVSGGKFLTGLTPEEKIVLEHLSGYKLNPTFNLNVPHEFYSTQIGKTKLLNQVLFFDLSNPLQYIKFKYLTNHFCVAPSQEAAVLNEYPLATHYIHSEADINVVEVTKASNIKEANALFASMNPKHLKHLYNVIFETDSRLLSDETIEAKILLYKQDNVAKFINIAKLSREEIQNRSIIIVGVSRNVVQFSGTSYIFDGINLGFSIDDAANTIAKPENQELKIRITTQSAAK